jgi:hypothetical protein
MTDVTENRPPVHLTQAGEPRRRGRVRATGPRPARRGRRGGSKRQADEMRSHAQRILEESKRVVDQVVPDPQRHAPELSR